MTRLVLGLCALAMLSACGVKGDLARPDPLWNGDEAIRRECERQIANNERPDARCAEYQSGAPPSQ